MHYLVPVDNETMTQFFDRVHRVFKCADNNGEKRPRLARMFRKGYKLYCEERKRIYWDRVAERFELEGAGTREGKRSAGIETCLDESGKEMRDANGRLIIKTFGRRAPGSRGGRKSTYRSRECRQVYLREANDDNTCKACGCVILFDKAKVLCVSPQEIGRKYVAVICKGCSQGENVRMHTRATGPVWVRLQSFSDSNVRAWIRWKLATLPDDKLEKFRKFVLRLKTSIHPRR